MAGKGTILKKLIFFSNGGDALHSNFKDAPFCGNAHLPPFQLFTGKWGNLKQIEIEKNQRVINISRQTAQRNFYLYGPPVLN